MLPSEDMRGWDETGAREETKRCGEARRRRRPTVEVTCDGGEGLGGRRGSRRVAAGARLLSRLERLGRWLATVANHENGGSIS